MHTTMHLATQLCSTLFTYVTRCVVTSPSIRISETGLSILLPSFVFISLCAYKLIPQLITLQFPNIYCTAAS